MAWRMVLSEQLERLTTALGISVDQLALTVETDKKTVYRWLADETFPQAKSRQCLDQLEKLVDRLDETFKTREGSQEWLHTASGYFGGMRPIDALLRGRIDLVDSALEALDAGVFV